MYISKRYPKDMEYIGETDWTDNNILSFSKTSEEYERESKNQVYRMCMRLNILDLSPKHLAIASGVRFGIISDARYGIEAPSIGDLQSLQYGMNKIEAIVCYIEFMHGEYSPDHFPKLSDIDIYYTYILMDRDDGIYGGRI